MRKYIFIIFAFAIVQLLSGCKNNTGQNPIESEELQSPEQLYGELFYDVMSDDALFGETNLLSEAKEFVDCVPLFSPEEIREKYSNLPKKKNTEILENFITENFTLPSKTNTDYKGSNDIHQHIYQLWTYLKCEPDAEVKGTLIPLKHPYIVPGGRFREIYYWDTYFTMLGLQVDKQDELIENIVANFSDLIDRVGFIPNGNRSYYLTRSQPPFYSYMVDILAEVKKDSTVYINHLKHLEKEYEFWMDGISQLSPTENSSGHTVRMKGGEILNRYCDKWDVPRAEMYNQDVKTASELKRQEPDMDVRKLYKNLRSAAESGWDFSSRWFEDGTNLYTIKTIDIIPVDLNCLLYHLESTLATSYQLNNQKEKAAELIQKSQARKQAILTYCWDENTGFFKDYDWVKQQQTQMLTLAGMYPLFTGIATPQQAGRVKEKIESDFLKAGGVVTTLSVTGEQWDAPNGWAPLQWITYKGLMNYGKEQTAITLRERWMKLNENIYSNTNKMLEKYDVVNQTDTGGGEYPNQDGFGWTNGVYRRFSHESNR